MDGRIFSLKEAEALTGLGADTLKKRILRGQLAAVKIPAGKREVWCLTEATIDILLGKLDNKSYQSLYKKWLDSQANGFLTGDKLTQASVDNNAYGLQNFWRYLNTDPNIQAISAKNLRLALAAVPVDREKQNCHYALRQKMVNAVRSFMRLLIEEGLRTQNDLDEVSKIKFRREYQPRRPFLYKDKLNVFLDSIEAHYKGKSSQTSTLLKTAFMISALAGLRRGEVVCLKYHDIDFYNQVIWVVNAKGGKTRRVGAPKPLLNQVKIWLAVRPQSDNQHLLLDRFGQPLKPGYLSKACKKISNRTGISITPHGLRRAYTTIALNDGMPLPLLRASLGHASILMTDVYTQGDEEMAIAYLRRSEADKASNKSPGPKKRRPR